MHMLFLSKVSHADPTSKYYKDLADQGYQLVEHELMKGKAGDKIHASMVLWFNKEPR